MHTLALKVSLYFYVFTSRQKSVKNDLGAVEEISKLSFPNRQKFRLCDAHPIFKP